MTTKHQVRERTNYAVRLLLLGHSTSVVVGKVAEREGCSRRTARRIAARALKVVKDDVDKVNIENAELAALLIHQLQEVAAKGLETGQLGSSVAALRELSAMVGIGCTTGVRLTTNTGGSGGPESMRQSAHVSS